MPDGKTVHIARANRPQKCKHSKHHRSRVQQHPLITKHRHNIFTTLTALSHSFLEVMPVSFLDTVTCPPCVSSDFYFVDTSTLSACAQQTGQASGNLACDDWPCT